MHGEGFTSGNIFLRGNPNNIIGTYYNGEKVVNQVGDFITFPSEMHHFVPANPTYDVRISMAMDIFTRPSPDIVADPTCYVHLTAGKAKSKQREITCKAQGEQRDSKRKERGKHKVSTGKSKGLQKQSKMKARGKQGRQRESTGTPQITSQAATLVSC
eukprot:gnl/MRDRNA2_/MRDRNA2_124629_c0_seq1.p1 gnl/MRDRNA2_/MRDRNA2_124629_c0~~gnl/MRDRNA2_/MRDRNA2_124629_c0_seq1.p1  ORF type:complete len:158 (+),score=17.99 gnl/MRDRNA2_/MRDRNA2_124629_c0_seq1:341-814(+)